MCGISGLFCLSDQDLTEIDIARVDSMCSLQKHRGPDDSGVVALGGVCLGTQRLAIQDLSAAGHMPMTEPTERWWITYNGEVYNFKELRAELERLGHEFRSATDTEVVLHAWIEWGRESLERLVGMFAFAIYDAEKTRLALIRDRYGIKPLYYLIEENRLLFSSEAKALYAQARSLRVDERGLAEWFLYRNPDALTSTTLVDGIESVLPGEMVAVEREARFHRHRYYTPISTISHRDFDENRTRGDEKVVEDLDEELNLAIRQRLVSDVPVGTLCSGGLDSSLVTAIAAKYSTDLTAFNVSIAEAPQLDERRFVETLTDELNIPLISAVVDGARFRRNLTRAVFFSDWPLTHPNSVAYLVICEVARQHGVVVLLTGEGADELFGGYSWNYRRLRYLLHLQPLLDRLPKRAQNLMAMLSYSMVGLPVTSHRFREAMPSAVALADRFARIDWFEQCMDAYAFVPDKIERNLLAKMLADLSDFLAPLLRRLDRMSMASSVECRVPFLDHRIVHRVANLPLRYRLRGRTDKWALRRVAAGYLPTRLAARSKMGFPLPLSIWLAPLANPALFIDGFCANSLGMKPQGLRLFLESWEQAPFAFFGLLTLEIWGRIHILGESVTSVDNRIAELESIHTSRLL